MKEEERISAQAFVQRLTALKNWEYLMQQGNEQANQEFTSQLALLKEQVILWGGITAIDQWLEINHPGHTKPSECDIDLINLINLNPKS